LFAVLWNLGDAASPLSGVRGATAAADFAAGRNIRLPKLAGRALGAAGQGSGLTLRTLGLPAGAETASHLLNINEQTIYIVGNTGLGGVGGGNVASFNGASGPSLPIIIPTVTPTGFSNFMVKL
jgi:hypothetical protein